MDRQKAVHYRDRAEAFIRLMRLGLDEEYITVMRAESVAMYRPGVALLAVHAGISLSDAVLIWLAGDRSRSENHGDAPATLRRACGRYGLTHAGVSHFEWLVRRKDDFAYGDRAVRPDDVASAVTHVERFQAWVYQTIPDLAEVSDDAAGTI